MGWWGRGYELSELHKRSSTSWCFQETQSEKLKSSGMPPFCSGSVFRFRAQQLGATCQKKKLTSMRNESSAALFGDCITSIISLYMLWHYCIHPIGCFIPITRIFTKSLKSILHVRPSRRASASQACAAVHLLLSTPSSSYHLPQEKSQFLLWILIRIWRTWITLWGLTGKVISVFPCQYNSSQTQCLFFAK